MSHSKFYFHAFASIFLVILFSGGHLRGQENALPVILPQNTINEKIPITAVAIDKSGTKLVNANRSGTLKIWNLNDMTSNRVQLFKNEPKTKVELINSRPRNVKYDTLVSTSHFDDVFALAFGQNGQEVISGGTDKLLIKWNIITGTISKFYKISDKKKTKSRSHSSRNRYNRNKRGRTSSKTTTSATVSSNLPASVSVTTMTISADGKYIAVGYADNVVREWNVQTGEMVNILAGHQWTITALSYSPDGKRLATADGYKNVIMWDVSEFGRGQKRKKRLFDIGSHSKAVNDIVFSPDGKYLLTSGKNPEIYLWNAKNGDLVHVFEDIQTTAVAFSPAGDFIFTGGANGVIKVWEMKSKSHVANLKGHSSKIISMTTTKTGLLVTAGTDKKINTYRVNSFQARIKYSSQIQKEISNNPIFVPTRGETEKSADFEKRLALQPNCLDSIYRKYEYQYNTNSAGTDDETLLKRRKAFIPSVGLGIDSLSRYDADKEFFMAGISQYWGNLYISIDMADEFILYRDGKGRKKLRDLKVEADRYLSENGKDYSYYNIKVQNPLHKCIYYNFGPDRNPEFAKYFIDLQKKIKESFKEGVTRLKISEVSSYYDEEQVCCIKIGKKYYAGNITKEEYKQLRKDFWKATIIADKQLVTDGKTWELFNISVTTPAGSTYNFGDIREPTYAVSSRMSKSIANSYKVIDLSIQKIGRYNSTNQTFEVTLARNVREGVMEAKTELVKIPRNKAPEFEKTFKTLKVTAAKQLKEDGISYEVFNSVVEFDGIFHEIGNHRDPLFRNRRVYNEVEPKSGFEELSMEQLGIYNAADEYFTVQIQGISGRLRIPKNEASFFEKHRNSLAKILVLGEKRKNASGKFEYYNIKVRHPERDIFYYFGKQLDENGIPIDPDAKG